MPTDDLCNFIENKAAIQNEGALSMSGGYQRMMNYGAIGDGTGGLRSNDYNKVKKRTPNEGQTMSIEDQESRGFNHNLFEDFNIMQSQYSELNQQLKN